MRMDDAGARALTGGGLLELVTDDEGLAVWVRTGRALLELGRRRFTVTKPTSSLVPGMREATIEDKELSIYSFRLCNLSITT